jgi:hypothetical protein
VLRLALIGNKKAVTPFKITLPAKPDNIVLNYLEDTLAVIR